MRTDYCILDTLGTTLLAPETGFVVPCFFQFDVTLVETNSPLTVKSHFCTSSFFMCLFGT